MIPIPKDNPVITGMNSYYLDVERLVDHYNGELESGVVYFHATTSEGAIFFDDHIPLTGVYESKTEKLEGDAAIGHLTDQAASQNFGVSIYRIAPDMVHYWANLSTATPLHANLSTEFTELKALLAKMQAEKLTGYIDIAIADGKEIACVFFNFGTIIAGSYSWAKEGLHKSEKLIRELLKKADDEGALLNVFQVEMDESAGPAASERTSDTAAGDSPEVAGDLAMMEDFLVIFETVVMSNKQFRNGFHTALKKKFIEKADTYHFLDPFAAEFEYNGGSIVFHGSASLETVARGLTESVMDLADEMNLRNDFIAALEPWLDRYGDAAAKYGLEF